MSRLLDERVARAGLSRLAEPGDLRLTSLTAQLGAPVLYDMLLGERELDGLRTDVAARLAAVDPERELDTAARAGIRFVIPGDAEWPPQLDSLTTAGEVQKRGGVPVGLWVRGPVRLDTLGASVAIVGARDSTTYGEAVAAEIAATVAGGAHPVVSGAAFGIDVASHRGALAADGATVAVLACGVDRVYPVAHRALLDYLSTHGAVISEAAPGCAPLKIRFLARNRIIAALTRATVVVEAAVRSGALNTAHWATRMNRPLLGVPGPVTSLVSGGVHELIRSGAATLATCGEDVLELAGVAGEHLSVAPRGEVRSGDRLSARERQVLDAVPVVSAAPADSIARVAGIGMLEVRGSLAALVRLGLVETADSGWRLARPTEPAP